MTDTQAALRARLLKHSDAWKPSILNTIWEESAVCLLRSAADALREGTQPAAPLVTLKQIVSEFQKARACEHQGEDGGLCAQCASSVVAALVTPEAAQGLTPLRLREMAGQIEAVYWLLSPSGDGRRTLRLIAEELKSAALVSSPAAAEKEKP